MLDFVKGQPLRVTRDYMTMQPGGELRAEARRGPRARLLEGGRYGVRVREDVSWWKTVSW